MTALYPSNIEGEIARSLTIPDANWGLVRGRSNPDIEVGLKLRKRDCFRHCNPPTPAREVTDRGGTDLSGSSRRCGAEAADSHPESTRPTRRSRPSRVSAQATGSQPLHRLRCPRPAPLARIRAKTDLACLPAAHHYCALRTRTVETSRVGGTASTSALRFGLPWAGQPAPSPKGP